MQNAGLRNPPVQERGDTTPAHLGVLTATDMPVYPGALRVADDSPKTSL
jgi:hypothetical protein